MTIRVYSSFDELPEEVASRCAAARQTNLFLSLDWFRVLFETSLASTLRPRIYVVFGPQGDTRCVLVCGTEIGSSARVLWSMSNYYTMEYAPIHCADAAQRDEAIDALVSHIAAERPRWTRLRLGLLVETNADTARIAAALEREGFDVQHFFQYENWYLPVAGSTFKDYFGSRSSQVRNTISRKQKKLEKAHRVDIEVVAGDVPELAQKVRDFMTVYGSSWKQPEPHPGFIPALAGCCARLGILRLGLLYVDGQPAAAQLWITVAGKATIYKLAYDERFAELGVGSVLSKEMFRVAIDEDRVAEIDYGVGSEPYKRDWMSGVRRIEGLEAYNRKTIEGVLQILAGRAKRTVKPAWLAWLAWQRWSRTAAGRRDPTG